MLVIVVAEGKINTVYQCKNGSHILLERNVDYEVVNINIPTDWLKPELPEQEKENIFDA